MKRVLIIDEGNAARSIMAEALLNYYLGDACLLQAQSAGLVPKGRVDREAIRALAEEGIATRRLRSKGLEEMETTVFDLVVTVCDNVRGLCPILPGAKREIHIGFVDPEGKPYETYRRQLHQMRHLLVPRIREELCLR